MNEPAPSDSTAVTVHVADAGSKYLYEDMAYIVCLIGLVATCALMCWIQFLPLGLVTTLGSVAFGAWIIKRMNAGHAERKRVVADPAPQLIIDASGISGSVAVLEGERRHTMDSNAETRFHLPWNNVSSVEFNTAHGRGGVPYMVIVPRDEFDRTNYYFVSREALWGKERALADKLREHGVTVTVEDALR